MSEPANNPFEPFFDEIRRIIREEIAAASKAQQPPKILLDTKEAADVLGVKESWLSAAARRGEVPSVRCGHFVKFRMSDLETFINEQRK